MRVYSQILRLVFSVLIASATTISTSLTFAQSVNQIQQNSTDEKTWYDLYQDDQSNFYEIRDAFNRYMQGKDLGKTKGWKQMRRWESFWEPRVFPSGKFPAPDVAMKEWNEMNIKNNGQPDFGSWSFLGPQSVPTGGGGAGRVNCVLFHPSDTSIIWVGAPAGGLWKTTDGGLTWSTNTDLLASLGVTDIVINPSNTNEMYIATGDGDAADTYSAGVLKSTDGGLTWNVTGLNWTQSQSRRISRLIIDPTNPSILYAATSLGVYKTSNAGSSWTLTQSGNFKDLEMKPGDVNTLYACSGANIYKTWNGASNWDLLDSLGLPASGITRIALAVTPANPDYIYALYANSSGSGFNSFWRSTNSGTSWTMMANSPNLLGWSSTGSDTDGQGWYDLAVAASPTNADVVFTGGVNIWSSSNGGSTWTIRGHWTGSGAAYVHADHHFLNFAPGNGQKVVSGNDGGFFVSWNTGVNWTDRSSGLHITQNYKLGASDVNASLVLTGTQDNGTNRLNGTSWVRVIGGDGMECAIKKGSTSIMYGELYYGNIRKSTNGGSSFSTIVNSGGSGVNSSGAWVTPFKLGQQNTSAIYVGKSQIYKSVNEGSSFVQLGTLPGSGNVGVLAISPADTNIIYVARSSSLYRTTNEGASWSTISTGLPGLSITDVLPHPVDTNTLWVTLSGYNNNTKIYKSVNAGATWTNVSGTTLPNVPANCAVYQNGSNDGIYLGTDLGVFYKDNSLSDWVNYSTSLPNVVIGELEIHYATSTIKAATYGRGLWESPLFSGVSLDAGISAINMPGDSTCGTSFIPEVEFSNFGGNSITTCDIYYQFSGGPLQLYVFNGNLIGGQSTSIALPAASPVNGNNTFLVYTANPNGSTDADLTNDTLTKNFYHDNSPPTAPGPISGPLVVCTGGTATYSVSAVAGAISYTWIPSGGVNIVSGQGSNSIDVSVDSAATLQVYAVHNCGNSAAVLFTISVNPLPSASIPVGPSVETCEGSGYTLLVTTNAVSPSYQWYNGASPIPGEVNPGFVPAVSGSYSCMVTDNASSPACSKTSNAVSVTVNPNPVIISVNTSANDICPGTAINLTANVTPQTTYPFKADFEPGHILWNLTNTSTGGVAADAEWKLRTSTYLYGQTPFISNDASTFYLINSDAHGSGNTTRTTISSPPIDLSNMSTAYLSWYHYFRSYSAGDSLIAVQISNDGGVSWNNLKVYTTTQGSEVAFVKDSVNLSSYLGQNGLQVRFNYVATWGWYWAFDNVCISGLGSQYDYSWSSNPIGFSGNTNPLNNVSPLVPTVFTVTVTNPVTTCSSSGTISINVFSPPAIVANATADTICSGGMVTLYGSGGIGYTWDQGVSDGVAFSPAQTQTYTVTGTDANGCTNTDSITIVIGSSLTASINASGPLTFCDGSSVVLSASGGTSYLWSDGSTLSSLLVNSSGTYVVTVSDGSGCTASAAATVVVNSNPPLSCSSTNVICFGASDGTALGSSPLNTGYAWSNGATTAFINGLAPGTYTLTLTDTGNGCYSTCSLMINEPTQLIASCSGTAASCNSANGTAQVSATGGIPPYVYTWSNGASTASISGLAAGNYTVVVTDVNACTATCSVSISSPAGFSLSATVTDLTCYKSFDGSMFIQINGGVSPYTYLWSDGRTNKNRPAVRAGIYTITVTDANGCSSSLTLTVNEPAKLLGTKVKTPVSCNGGSDGSCSLIITGGTPPYTYQWNTVPVQTTAMATGLSKGVYQCITTDANGCTRKNTVFIAQPALLWISMSKTDVSINGGSDGTCTATPAGGNAPYLYLWDNGATTSNISGLVAGTYTCTVTDSNGCTVSKSKNVNQPPLASEEQRIEEEDFVLQAKLFPNPNHGIFTIEIENPDRDMIKKIEILSGDGRKIYERNLHQNEVYLEEKFALENIPSGMYVLKILSRNQVLTKRFAHHKLRE